MTAAAVALVLLPAALFVYAYLGYPLLNFGRNQLLLGF